MRASHLLFSHGKMILALPAERIQRIQEAGSVVPFPGAGTSVRGLAACGGRSRVVLNLPGLFLFAGTTCPETLSDRPPLWALLDGIADGLILEIPAPLSFSTPETRTSRPPGSEIICDQGWRHPAGAAGLISPRRLLLSLRRSAGTLAVVPSSQADSL